MSKELVKGAMFFLIFFFLGLGIISAFNFLIATEPVVEEDSIPLQDGTIRDVANRVSPSVVGITNLSTGRDMFDQRDTESTGSGVILDNEGHIATNYHVVRNADKIIVTLIDGNEKEAKIIGTDPRTDLAVIKIEVKNKVTPANFGDSEAIEVGEEVVAIGNPLGLRFARSVTAGVVSGLNRLLTTEEGMTFSLVQTDAAINPGNSGGALINLDGDVVGINTIKIAAEGFEGMGFAIPSNQVKMVINDILEHGRVIRPLMGIRILGEFSEDETDYFKIPNHCGVVVEPVRGGAADQAGIRKNDIITKINGKDIETTLELEEKVFKQEIGSEIQVEIIRMPLIPGPEPQKKTVTVMLEQEA
ncbi:Serine protease, DegP/HtrA, do-like [Candidatus Syntrophocurvum alkaliphilum]|uniref:Serine protease, DegP/HtrA, do-like n=1 Tax=Candidatus Syntrophocurvum alkaliphilum TaxID=2293317 RepID=A0A6I6DDK4_9FIRM|nr:trypsin-like peptidase domain-containing protein [Candidatus Syntrophocurvum alkaliphilum]QGU00655.1 Serine protease, DegP/HtrA, do-like [Candidatus Syntrophocurvum alkaliphilum]